MHNVDAAHVRADVVRSVVCVSVCWAHGWDVQIKWWTDQDAKSCWTEEPCIVLGSISDKSICSCRGDRLAIWAHGWAVQQRRPAAGRVDGYVPLRRHLVLLWMLRCSCHIVILTFIIITAKIVFFAKTRAYVFINIHIYYTLAYIMCTEERWSWCRSSDDVGKFRWQCLPSLCHGTWRSYRWTVISLISSQPQWLDTRSRNRYIVVILVVYHWCFLVVFSLLLSCCYHSWSWRLQNFTFPIRSLVL